MIFADYNGGSLTVTAQENIIGGMIIAQDYQQTSQVLNIETGNFTGCSTTGNTSIETANFGSGPVEGTFQARITSSTE